MIKIAKKASERLQKGFKKFQPILKKAKEADINESDTVTIITDMLNDIFGYDKFENITSEFAIKKTYCDLAIKLDENEKPVLLIECKAAGLNLKEDYVRQATNYAADSGVDWVVLTNGIEWKIYKIHFTKPVEKELVYEFNMLEMNLRKTTDLESLYYLAIESLSKSTKDIDTFYKQKQIINRYIIGQIVLTETITNSIKKQLKKLSPESVVTTEEISMILTNEVLKREIVEGDEATDAKKKVKKLEAKPKKAETKE